jgi:hypothetical protein
VDWQLLGDEALAGCISVRTAFSIGPPAFPQEKRTVPVKKPMVKPLHVKEVAYVHATDVDDTKRMNIAPTDAAMEECVNWGAQALMQQSASHPVVQTLHMRSVLVSMRWTHRLVRKVLGYEKPNEKPMVVDGLSLARIPLEGLFTLSLMLEDPVWVDRYLRDGWKKQYTKFLLQREETRRLPRFDAYNYGSGPENLTRLQQVLGVTEAQRATIEFNETRSPVSGRCEARRN